MGLCNRAVLRDILIVDLSGIHSAYPVRTACDRWYISEHAYAHVRMHILGSAMPIRGCASAHAHTHAYIAYTVYTAYTLYSHIRLYSRIYRIYRIRDSTIGREGVGGEVRMTSPTFAPARMRPRYSARAHNARPRTRACARARRQIGDLF